MKLTTTTLKRFVLIEQKKFGTESRLRRQIREHVKRLLENDAAAQGGASGFTPAEIKKLKGLNDSPPGNLSGFATSIKTLGGILGDIDEKTANLNSAQIKMYFEQIMKIVNGMTSDKKTSSAETAKVAKATAAP